MIGRRSFRRRGGAIEIHKIGHRGGNHLLGSLGPFQQMTFEHRRGFRQAMGQFSGYFKLTERQGPAVLPVQRQTAEHQHCSEHPDQTAIRCSMKACKQRGLSSNSPS